MNHDCTLNYLDLKLVQPEFLMVGPNLSADFDGSGFVNFGDVGTLVNAMKAGVSVAPCTPSGMLPDQCEGRIALSFGSDPTTIISTFSQPPGAGIVYVVVDGWTGADTLEYAVETSSNINIVSHDAALPAEGAFSSVAWCDLSPQQSLRMFMALSGPWPAVPISAAELDYVLLDGNPAWIRLVPLTSCYPDAGIRWGQPAANRSFDFAAVLNAGINGPAPPGEPTCSAALSVPTMNPFSWYALGGALLTAAALVSVRRRNVTI